MKQANDPHILYIVSQLGQGGAEQQLYYLLKYLKPQATVVSLAQGGYWGKPFRDLGYEVIELLRRGSFDLKRLQAVRQVIQQRKPDLIHVWMDGVPGAYGRLAGLMTGFPVVLGIRNHPTRDPGWYRNLTQWWLNRHVTMVVANAQSSCAYMVEQGRVPRKRVRFIPNGIELERFAASPSPDRKAILPQDWRDKIIVGTVGRLAEDKSPETYVRVAKQVLDQCDTVRFIHAGDGHLKARVTELSRELGIDQHLLYLGPRQDIPNVLRALDIFMLTSMNEGTPNAAMEAMATHLPCLVTDVGDCKEIVLDGQTGFVVAPGDEAALANRLLQLVPDAELRARMGSRGYDFIQQFDVYRMADQYRRLYQDVLSAVRVR